MHHFSVNFLVFFLVLSIYTKAYSVGHAFLGMNGFSLIFCVPGKFFQSKSDDESIQPKVAKKRGAGVYGILKQECNMKVNGSLVWAELNLGSEILRSTSYGVFKQCIWSERSSFAFNSNSSMEDESSSGSITESDLCSANEDIRSKNCCKYSYNSLSPQPVYGRDSCISLPSSLIYSDGSLSSFRNSLPPPPLLSKCYISGIIQNSTVVHRNTEKISTNNVKNFSKPHLLPNDQNHFGSQFSSTDINENYTKSKESKMTSRKSEHLEIIEESERHQLEIFFRSLKTDVFVCGSLVNLYFGWKENEGNWIHRYTGVIVVILDFGDTRSRNKRKIHIVLAERGTCFPLWKDTIDNLSAYHKSGTAFHTMHLSSDHRQIVGLSFDSPSEADTLLKHINELTSNPENINISVPGSKKKNKCSQKKKPTTLPHKKQISNPCLFQHVTSIAAKDKPIYMSLQTLIDSDIIKKKENIS